VENRSPGPLAGEVELRDVAAGDLPIFFDHQVDPEATRMAGFPAKDREAFMADWTMVLGDETIEKQTILVDGQVAGNIVGFDQDGRHHVGYWIGKAFWGQGIATRALSAFLGAVATRPLYAHVAKHNVASRRVLEKCGFVVCGEARSMPGEFGVVVEELVLVLGANARDDAP
jgi:RimJ/RimL family protein N-acetyltransferase